MADEWRESSLPDADTGESVRVQYHPATRAFKLNGIPAERAALWTSTKARRAVYMFPRAGHSLIPLHRTDIDRLTGSGRVD
jgi:hypothetical protein